MRILHSDDDRLIIRHRPWFTWIIAAILLAGALHEIFLDQGIETWERFFTAAIATGMIWLVWWGLPGVDLCFDRQGLSFAEHRFTGTFTRTVPLEQIHGILTETNPHVGAAPNRLILETTEGDLPLERGFGPFDRKEIAAQIATWLDQAHARFTDR